MSNQRSAIQKAPQTLIFRRVCSQLPVKTEELQPQLLSSPANVRKLTATVLRNSGSGNVICSGHPTVTAIKTGSSLKVDSSSTEPIRLLNFTGDVIKLTPVSSVSDSNTNKASPSVVRLFKIASNGPVVSSAPQTTPNKLHVTSERSTLRPCIVCHVNTANLHGKTATCPACKSFFYRTLNDIDTHRRLCNCPKAPTKMRCVHCRLVEATESALSKWGGSMSDRARMEWSIVDNSLASLARTPCSLNDIARVHEEIILQTYADSTVLPVESPKSKTSRSRRASNIDLPEENSLPAGSFKRRAIDQNSWVSANSQLLTPTSSTQSVSHPIHVLITQVPMKSSNLPMNNTTENSTDRIEDVEDLFTGGTSQASSPTPSGSDDLPIERKRIAVSSVTTAFTPVAVQPVDKPTILFQNFVNGDDSESSTSLPQIASAHGLSDPLSMNSGTSISIGIPVTMCSTPVTNSRKESVRSLVKDDHLPPSIMPKTTPTATSSGNSASRRSVLNQEQVLARRLSRLIKPSFMQVYTKHFNDIRTEPKLIDVAMDNHGTLFQLFEFYDWEWNQPIEVSQSVRQACWSVFHEQLNESLTDMVRFIKRIPGFPILKPHDRILLVRNSGFELAFMAHYLYWNTEFGTWHGPDHFVLTLDQLITIFPAGELFFQSGFASAQRLAKLTQQLQHLGQVAALVILNSDLDTLSDRETVEALREKMMNAIRYSLNTRSQDPEKIMLQVSTAVDGLREMGSEHRILLDSLREEDHFEFPDDLYAELFELVGE